MPDKLAGMRRLHPQSRESAYVSPSLTQAAATLFGSVVLRGFVVDAGPDLVRQGLRELLLEVADEPDRARHDRHAAGHAPGQPELAEEGADGASGIDRQLALVGARSLAPDLFNEAHVAA